MKLPQKLQEFINKKIVLENYCLPHFYPKKNLFEDFQIGYKINGNNNEKITGEDEGDFRENWFVICSSYTNDPFFININEEKDDFPIYFAWHGAGKWIPIKVSKNIIEFSKQLELLKLLELNKENIQEKFKESLDINNEFWTEVFNGYEEFHKDEEVNKSTKSQLTEEQFENIQLFSQLSQQLRKLNEDRNLGNIDLKLFYKTKKEIESKIKGIPKK